jgi:methylamine--corrinoid protein Co-methyltransferase
MTPPWRIPTVLDRSETGPICLERDFDIRLLYPKVREMVKKHGISFDPENVIPTDDLMADELWKAGLELYLDVGTLCTTTHRRILFSEAEIREALSLFPEKLVVGENRDSREVYQRKIEDGRRPFCVFSPSLPFSEELFVPVEMTYAMEPLADGVGAPVLDELLGRKVRGGSPSDIGSGMAHDMMIREAVRRVGRPGVYLADVQSALSDTAQIAASNPSWGVRCRDGHMVGSIAELKMDYGGLNRMVNFHEGG